LNATLPNTTFSWTVVATGVSGASSGSGNTIAQTLFPTLDALGSVNYIVTPIADGCAGTPFNVQVRVRPKPRIVSGNNAATCDGQGIYLTPNANYPTNLYSWTVTQMNGVTGAVDGTAREISQTLHLTGDSDGTVVYTIIPTYQGCIGDPFHITVTVYALPKPVLVSGNICVDPTSGNTIRSYLLDSGLNNTTHHFEWTHNGVVIPGATSSTYEATLGGDYSVIATNDQTGCVSAEVFATVTPIFVPTAMTAAGTEAFSENASIVVSVKGGTGPFFYQLDNGPLQSSNVFSGLGGGTYTVKVIDEYGCTDLETEVTLIDYPKFFTPNGDGYNDYWNIFSLSGQPAEISIFDRYGKLVKQISTRGEGWDGIYNGHLLPSTDYWFTVDYTENKIPKVFRAHFSLKR
jgi:gliding motility-associated-like protein